MRQFIVIFCCALVFCVIFINSPRSIMFDSASIAIHENGQILGVSEVSFDIGNLDISMVTTALPTNKDSEFYPPQIKDPGSSIELPYSYNVLFDLGSQTFLREQGADKVVPIASISKLAAVLVFLEHNPGWEAPYRIKESDVVSDSRQFVFPGEFIRVRDLFYLSLIASDNTATIALINATGLDKKYFMELMNKKADDLGLKETRFIDPIGFSGGNVSTAREVALLAQAAFREPEIIAASQKNSHKFKTIGGREREARSTNRLLSDNSLGEAFVEGGKTGYTALAGYCFVGKFRDQADHEIISVVLGAPHDNDRFSFTKKLVAWTYDNFEWR